ncbi:hypothetical protein C0989_008653 [Termitomyces sp. Mn162]|nr:hypothetical protein C0989_008653 [Termitomyces sp. Mn162]
MSHHTQLQQRLLHDTKTVLVTVDTMSTNAPVKHGPAANANLCAHINKLLSEIDKTGTDLAATDGVPPTPSKTHVQGIIWLKCSMFLFEFDTPDSAGQFWSYAHNPVWDLAKTCLGGSVQVVDKAHTLILCFIPCRGVFDPSNAEDISTLKIENGLPRGCITLAAWLKKEDHCHAKQMVASLKVLCNSIEAANLLLQEWVFITGHLVVVCKDIWELLCCNKC